MGQEIERKFLVAGGGWRPDTPGVVYRQGYMPTQAPLTVRVRLAGDDAYLTLKGPATGITRAEFEYAIPWADGEDLIQKFCAQPLIEKTRYRIPVGDHIWEVDEFVGENAGLVLAEIELSHEAEPFVAPPWLGQEVSHDPRYRNSYLASQPYKNWAEEIP